MAITIEEIYASQVLQQNKEGERLTRVFNIFGTHDVFLAAQQGPQIGDIINENLRLVDQSMAIKHETGDDPKGLIQKTVVYETTTLTREDDFGFSTIAESEHIEAVRKNSDQEHFPESKGVGQFIGVNGDRIDGVDTLVPKPRYNETHERNTLDGPYRNILTDLSGSINDQPFKGFKTGEVLFLGAEASRRGFLPWTIRYEFLISLDATFDVDIIQDDGSSATINVNKKGWTYFWVRHSQSGGAAGDRKIILHRIESVHLAKVYESKDFSTLGIGTAIIT